MNNIYIYDITCIYNNIVCIYCTNIYIYHKHPWPNFSSVANINPDFLLIFMENLGFVLKPNFLRIWNSIIYNWHRWSYLYRLIYVYSLPYISYPHTTPILHRSQDFEAPQPAFRHFQETSGLGWCCDHCSQLL